MARWYGTFDNSTVSALEALTTGNRFQRKAMTDGAALKSALVSARDALSAAVYAQLNAGNRRGDTGIVIPQDGFSRAGGNLSWSNLYTNPDAIYPLANPRIRPESGITVAGSTPLGTTDGGIITESLYTAAQSALEDIITELGVRSRLGNEAWRTLAALWHDHALNYFAWDDFTPGQPQSVSIPSLGGNKGNANQIIIPINFSEEYPADLDCSVVATAMLFNGGVFEYAVVEQVESWNEGVFNLSIPEATLTPGNYSITGTLRFRDPNIATSHGLQYDFSNGAVMVVVEGEDS